MIAKEFEFHAPRALDQALALLSQYGSDATLLAGGMSLVPAMNLGLVQPQVVISLNHVPELDYVVDAGASIRIGALVRHHRVASDPLIREHIPLLSEAARVIGDVQVRHRGTLGGSLSHADPAADYLPVVLALGARLKLRSAGAARSVEAREFFLDLMTTARQPEEMLVEVELPKKPAGAGAAYQRLARVEGSFAIVNAAAVVEPGFAAARLALGGVGPTPLLLDVSASLRGGLTPAALDEVGEAAFQASHAAMGDVASDAEYRRAMARVYARRALRAAASRLQ